MKYPKLQTLFNRDEKRKMVIIPDEISKPEFQQVKYWEVTEKIDGTNIRIVFELQDATRGYSIGFEGRGDDSQIPKKLLEYLKKTFTTQKLHKVFVKLDGKEPVLPRKVILYGEGYGVGIGDKGKFYLPDTNEFMLFDVWVDEWWLEYENIADVAKKLKIAVVPSFGIMSMDEAIELVKTKRKSRVAELVMEGVVAKSNPQVLFRNKDPIMWKLKCRDFTKLENEMMKQ